MDVISPISQMRGPTLLGPGAGCGISPLTHTRCICWVNVQCWIRCLFCSDDAHLSFVRDEWFPPLLMSTWPMSSALLLEKQSLKQMGGGWLWKPWPYQPRESIKRASWVNMRPLRTVSSVPTTENLLCGFLSAKQLDSGHFYTCRSVSPLWFAFVSGKLSP